MSEVVNEPEFKPKHGLMVLVGLTAACDTVLMSMTQGKEKFPLTTEVARLGKSALSTLI